ncbi:MAG: tRNA-intron lyase [Methanobacteriota archaeon]|nr:MAG: tRNA-intron lyase [Euryarchaeota archaeon]
MGERAGSAYIRCARTLPPRNPLSRVPASRRAMPGDFRGDKVIVEDPAEASALHNRGSYGEPLGGGGVSLTLLEAVYLVETGRLAVHRDRADVPMRTLFRGAAAAYDQFEIKYVVYRDLRQRGYVVVEGTGPPDFLVYPRGGTPKKSPAKYWVAAISERAVFDAAALAELIHRVAGMRKQLLLAVVDEESDLTYYAVRESDPKGRPPPARPDRPIATAHLLEDRAMVVEEAEARALHGNGFYGKIVGRRLQLSLIETAHLLKLGAIDLRNADTDRRIALPRLVSEARRIQPDFDLRLAVYEDLKARGIVAKTGFKYGSHFRAYEGDPDRTHAKYLVHALPEAYRGMWPEVSRAVRLAHGVKKSLLFAAAGDSVRYIRLERVRP